MELKAKKYNLWDMFVLMFKASPVWTSLYVLIQLLEALMPTISIFTTAGFVDTAIAVLNGTNEYNDIFLPLGVIIGMFVVERIIWVGDWIIDVQLRAKTELKFSEMFLNKRAKLKYHYIEDSQIHDLITRVGGADQIANRGRRLTWWVYWVVNIITTLSVVFAYVWWSGIVAIVVAIPAVVIAVKNGLEKYKTFSDTEHINRYANVYQSMLGAKDFLEEKTTFGYTKYAIERWLDKKTQVDDINLKTTMRTSWRENIVTCLAWVMWGAIVISLVPAVEAGMLTAGMFIGIANGVMSLVNIVAWNISWQVDWAVQAIKHLKDLTEFSMLEDQEGALDLPCDMSGTGIDSIEFRDVSFKYPKTDRYILKNCSFTIKGNEHYAFVGINGAGKTTITKLLTGLYDNYEGKIFINGKNLRDYKLAELKGLFSIVYQDYAKYQIEFKDNIKLGDTTKDDDEAMMKAVHDIGLDEALSKLHSGVDTPLGKVSENGVDLSGGEWQRVAIARTLYSDAPMTILDEPTAALDPIAESGIYEMFRDVTRDRSAIFITHRLGAAKIADKILVVDDGKIVEFGSHKELMEKNGLYAEMFNTQKGWYEA